MTQTATLDNHIVAFDVGKQKLEVATLPASSRRSITNTKAAIRTFLKAEQRRNTRLALPPILVVCEATGGYERVLLDTAFELGLDSHRAEGRKVRLFAMAHGQRAKTDPLDAPIIANFANNTDCSIRYVPPPADQRKLIALVARRDDLMKMHQAEHSRQEHVTEAFVKKSFRTMMRALKKQLQCLEKEIKSLINSNPELSRKDQLMQSVTGVGAVTAFSLLAAMPELGTLSKGQAAALIGLAPYNNDSGKTNLRRHISAGRFQARRSLYMAAWVAIANSPDFEKKYQSLTQRGKPKKVAHTAIMRKIIVILNAILKSGEPWKGAKTT